MTEEFVKICLETFPQIGPEQKKRIENILKQYKSSEKIDNYFTTHEFEYLNQGDIYTPIKWWTYTKDGDIIEMNEKAFLLSTTCDADRKDNLVFAAVRPISEAFEGFKPERIEQAKRNELSQFLYLPGSSQNDYIIDLNMIFSIPRELFNALIEKEIVKKETTLSNEGLYLFIIKFTIAYMRWQDPEVYEGRAS